MRSKFGVASELSANLVGGVDVGWEGEVWVISCFCFLCFFGRILEVCCMFVSIFGGL